MSQLQSHVRYRGLLVSIADVRCRPSTSRGPTRCQQDGHADFPARQILLVTKILICSDEGVKSIRFGASQ